jgi:esterase/lipase
LSRSCQKKVQKNSKVFTKLTKNWQKWSKSVKKLSKLVKKIVKKLKKVVKNFVTPGKNPNINNGAILEKMQWCIEKNKKPMVQ